MAVNGAAPTVSSYTYNAGNQLVSDGTNTLTYDNNGNLTSDGVNSYISYDRANKLLQVTDGTNTTTYRYDGEGRRVQQTVSSTVTKYLLDIQPGLSVVLSETTGSNVVRNIHAPKGIHARKDASSNWHWIMQDGLGSVRAEVSNTIAVEGSQNFAPYGTPTDSLGSFGTYGFTGEPTDANGLVYDRARYYVPSIGMFASLDPFEGFDDEPMSINGYSYVHGNPVNWTDPSGEFLGALAPAIVACALNPLCAAGALLLTAAAAAAFLWLQSHPDEVNNAARDAAKVINAGLCVINAPKLLPHILTHPVTPPVVPHIETYPADQSPVSPIYPNVSPIIHPIPLVFDPPPNITTGSPGFPSNPPIDIPPLMPIADDNYRGRYFADRRAKKLVSLPDSWDVHHWIPQVFGNNPIYNGFDINNPSNLRGVAGADAVKAGTYPTNVHSQITKAWEKWRKANPNPTKSQIENFASEIDAEFGQHWWETINGETK